MKHKSQEVETDAQATEPGEIVRFTVDMSESMHHDLSLLAVKQRKTKVELVRFAIAQLLKDMQDDTTA